MSKINYFFFNFHIFIECSNQKDNYLVKMFRFDYSYPSFFLPHSGSKLVFTSILFHLFPHCWYMNFTERGSSVSKTVENKSLFLSLDCPFGVEESSQIGKMLTFLMTPCGD